MPKKKVAPKGAKPVPRKTAKAVKVVKATRRPAKKTSVPTIARKPVAAPARKKAAPVAAPSAKESPRPEPTLGRPLVTQEEKLYMLFHDDYQARQVFEFLRVVTVKELEAFSPQQIVHLMSKPLRMTVDRIRQRLAQYKRALKDDEAFAAEFRRQAGDS